MRPNLGKAREGLLTLLIQAQGKHSYLTPKLMAEIAESLGLSLGDIYGVVTFYSFLSVKPQGRNIIRICKSLPCFLKYNQAITESIAREIGIGLYETTPDGQFSLQLTNCIGACDQAPAMMVNSDIYTKLTPRKISRILGLYR